jgi:stress-induced morphogen
MKETKKSQKKDVAVEQIQDVLAAYGQIHKNAVIDVRRRHEVSIHIRILDPDFRGLNRVERHSKVEKFLEPLPDEIYADITVLLLLTPDEAPNSFANMEFENPISWPIRREDPPHTVKGE